MMWMHSSWLLNREPFRVWAQLKLEYDNLRKLQRKPQVLSFGKQTPRRKKLHRLFLKHNLHVIKLRTSLSLINGRAKVLKSNDYIWSVQHSIREMQNKEKNLIRADHLQISDELEINGDIKRVQQRRYLLYEKRNILNYNILIDKNLNKLMEASKCKTNIDVFY